MSYEHDTLTVYAFVLSFGSKRNICCFMLGRMSRQVSETILQLNNKTIKTSKHIMVSFPILNGNRP